ncbi:MAG: guanylate kinase [Steroidobacteraceae bacterium]
MIAAPSGAGKTSLVKALLARRPGLAVSVSHTTRPQRPSEVAGRDYHFVTVPEFLAERDAGGFLEYAEVYGNYYGTHRAEVERSLAEGRTVILEIDWQGAEQVRRSWPGCTSIFILPPSRATLEARLRNRRTDSDEVIARRLAVAEQEMSHFHEFDCVIVNDDFEQAVEQLLGVLDGRTADLGPDRAQLAPLLAGLLAGNAAMR